MSVKPIPDGYNTLTTYLSMDNTVEAIDFYKRAFGAVEIMRMSTPDGRIGHAELQIGDSKLMMADSFEQSHTKSPKELGGTTGGVFMYVDDVDSAFKRAIDAGAESKMDPEDMFWGDRFGSLLDPFGHSWSLATHVEDVPENEMEKRGQEAMAQMAAQHNGG